MACLLYTSEHFVKRLVQAKEIYLRGEMPKIEEANMRKAQDVKNVLYKLMEK